MRRKKRNTKKNSNYRKKGWWASIPLSQRVFAILGGLLLIGALIFVLVLLCSDAKLPAPSLPTPNATGSNSMGEIDSENQNMKDAKTPEEVSEMDISGFTDVPYVAVGNVGSGLTVARVGTYSGKFVEDGSNREVSDVLAIVVTNNSDDFVELANFFLYDGPEPAQFTLLSLPVGQSALVMEKSAKVYDGTSKYGGIQLADFTVVDKEFSLYPEVFTIRADNGVVNLVNKSGKTIFGNIYINYKNVENGIYIGGINYRAEYINANGLPDGNVAQFMVNNYFVGRSDLIFIRYEN